MYSTCSAVYIQHKQVQVRIYAYLKIWEKRKISFPECWIWKQSWMNTWVTIAVRTSRVKRKSMPKEFYKVPEMLTRCQQHPNGSITLIFPQSHSWEAHIYSPSPTPLAQKGRLAGSRQDSPLSCIHHELHETCHSIRFYFIKKKTPNDAVHHNARVNSHQRWKQTRFRVCFHLWCELTSTMNLTEWQAAWISCVHDWVS